MTTYEMRHLHEDGLMDGMDGMDKREVIGYLRSLLAHLVHNDDVTRLTIDTAFGTIEIMPQGGLSLLVE